MSLPGWITLSIWCHIRMWHSKTLLDVSLCRTPIVMSYGTLCFSRYQMTNEIIIRCIHIYANHSKKSRFIGVSWNKLHIFKLAHDSLRKIYKHQMCPTSQPSRVEDLVIQGTRLTLTIVRLKAYIICYCTIKIHFECLDRMVPYKQDECINTWHILTIVINKWPARDTWELLEDPYL